MNPKSRIPFFLLLFIATLLSAQVKVEESFDRGIVTVGDRVTFTLKVTLPAKAQVKDLPGGMLLQAFEIKDYDLGAWKTQGERKTITQRFSVSTFTTGVTLVSPWTLKVKEGKKETALDLPPVPLVVSSVLEGKEAALHDIRDPLQPPGKIIPTWLAIVAGIVILVVLALVFYFRRRSMMGKDEDLIILPPHIVAFDALKSLEEKALMEKGEIKAHYVALADILKTYLEGRFNVDTLDKTTGEMVAILNDLPLDRSLEMKIREFLATSDLVKFAKQRVKAERGENDLHLVEEVVRTTMEREESVEEEERDDVAL